MDNVLFDPNTLSITAVLDWEASLPDSLPFDMIHFLVSEKRMTISENWGELLAMLACGNLFDDDDRNLMKRYHEAVGFEDSLFQPFIFAYWARGVAVRLQRSGGLLQPVWRRENLVKPLEVFSNLIS